MKIHVTYEFESEDEVRAHFGGETRQAAAAPAPEETRAPDPVVTADVDGDGMPWNDAYHSTPKSFTDDGLWRAKRGKAEEAKAARAEFKARGGASPAPTMPVAAAAPTMPTMPVAAPILPEPVSFERLVGKITGMMQRGRLSNEQVIGLYSSVGATSGTQFETNESLRAALMVKLTEIEPEG